MMMIVRMVVLFIVLTGLVHIFSIIATPFFAEQKVWQKVVDYTPPRKLKALKSHKEAVAILGQADPGMAYALCHFSLDNGPVILTSDGPTSFWNVTLFNKEAEVIYSLNDGASRTSQLNLSITQRGRKSEAITDLPADDLASIENDDLAPTASSPSLSDETEEQDEGGAELSEEDGGAIQARVSENQVFVVLKIFKASRHHAKLIEETLQAAQCR